MSALQRIVHTVSGLFGQIPEWAPHDHTGIGRNVPYGMGVERLWRGSSYLPMHGYGGYGMGYGAGFGGYGTGYGAYGGWNAMAMAPAPVWPGLAWGGASMLGAVPAYGYGAPAVRYGC